MSNPKNTATLLVAGKKFTAWKSLSVRLSYGDTSRVFQLTCSDAKGEAAQLLPGQRCVIQLGGQAVFTGWITTRGVAYDAETHDVVIGGKSLTTDVHESAMPIQPGNFNGYTAEQMIRAALAPHKVELVVKNAPPTWSKPFSFFATNPGETALDFIDRAAVMRGAFLWDDEQGRMCVGNGRPGAPAVADLVEGRNILRLTGKIDDQSAVSEWNTYGQQAGIGDDFSMRASQGRVTDPIPRPNRKSVTHCPGSADGEDAATFAGMMAASAGWKTVQIDATVASWYRPDGKLWELTDNCTVRSPMALPGGANKMTLGTQSILFSQDDKGGTSTTLTLVRPEFLTPVGHAGVTTDGAGNITSNPGAPQPVAPDYAQGQ